MAEIMPPRMRIVWSILEAAKDARDEMVISACRRLINADRIGWRKHHAAADYVLVRNVYADLAG